MVLPSRRLVRHGAALKEAGEAGRIGSQSVSGPSMRGVQQSSIYSRCKCSDEQRDCSSF